MINKGQFKKGHKGLNPKGSNKGRKFSDEWKANMSKARLKNHADPNCKIGFQKGDSRLIANGKKMAKINGVYKKGHVVTDKTREKIRNATISYREKHYKGAPCCIGKHEKHVLDTMENFTNYPIKRQHQVGGYFLDGYSPALNLAIEVDEPHHKNQMKKDLYRENFIKKKLNCVFLRIPVPGGNQN